jgi:hypothetical protein
MIEIYVTTCSMIKIYVVPCGGMIEIYVTPCSMILDTVWYDRHLTIMITSIVLAILPQYIATPK